MPVSPTESPEGSPRADLAKSSPRSLTQRKRSASIGGAINGANAAGHARTHSSNSPRAFGFASMPDLVWLMRPEVRETVTVAVRAADAGPAAFPDDLKHLLERCIFTTRVPAPERVRELTLVARLWGGPEAVLQAVIERLGRMDAADRVIMAELVVPTVLAWFSHDGVMCLEPPAVAKAMQIFAMAPKVEMAPGELNLLILEASKPSNNRPAPLLFPARAPSETNRLGAVDVTKLTRSALAEEIVHTCWRIFISIRAPEWTAYARLFGVHARPVLPEDEPARTGFGCDSILSLIQFSLALRRWILSTVALKLEKARVVRFWADVADLCISVNALHCGKVIFGALQCCLVGNDGGTEDFDGPLIRGWPELFPSTAVQAMGKLTRWNQMLPKTLQPLVMGVIASMPSSVSVTKTVAPSDVEAFPVLPPLSLLTKAVDRCITRSGDTIACVTSTLAGVLQGFQLFQSALRTYGVGTMPLSHDMFDLLQAMPLLTEPMLHAAARATQALLDEGIEYSTLDSDTVSSERMSSEHLPEAAASIRSATPPRSPHETRPPSPMRTPGGSPTSSVPSTPRSPTAGASRASRLMKERTELGMSLSYRVRLSASTMHSAKAKAASALVSAFIISASGRMRLENEPSRADDADTVRFVIDAGTVCVSWVRGLSWLGRVMSGRTPLGFHTSIVDDILFGWRLLFRAPSELLRVILSESPPPSPKAALEHLLPTQIADLDSESALRRRVLYIIKRWVEIEKASLSALTSDGKFMELWNSHYVKLRDGCASVTPLARKPSAPAATSMADRATPQQLSRTPASMPSVSGVPSSSTAVASSGSGGGGGGGAGERRALASSLRSVSALSLGATGQGAGFMAEEFICASSIEWVMRNIKARVKPVSVAPPVDWNVRKMAAQLTNAVTLVENLTMLEQSAFCSVGVDELLGFPKAVPEEKSSLGWLVARFNRTSCWVASSVLAEEDVAARAQLLLFFMRMSIEALQMGNLMMSFALFAGVESLAISRLKQTWAKVDSLDAKRVVRADFEVLRDTYNPAAGQQQLRFYHIQHARLILIPFLGLWTKDLFLIDRNNATFLGVAQTLRAPAKRISHSAPEAQQGVVGVRPVPLTLDLWGRSGSMPEGADNVAAVVARLSPKQGTSEATAGSALPPIPTSPKKRVAADVPQVDENGLSPPDISMCDMGDEHEATHSVINVEKLTMVTDALSSVIFFQGSDFISGSGRVVLDPIEHCTTLLDEEALYQLSIVREPPKH